MTARSGAGKSGLQLQRLDSASEAALLPNLVLDVSVVAPGADQGGQMEAEAEVVGEWTHGQGYTPRGEMPPLRRFFRVGIVQV